MKPEYPEWKENEGAEMTKPKLKTWKQTREGVKMADPEKEFDEILLEAVDRTLSALGESVKEALYFHLETKFSIKGEIVCRDPSVFSNGLRKIFGPGAKFIEKTIIEFLHRKTECELNPSWQKCCFAKNIEKIREYFIKCEQQNNFEGEE